MTIPTEAKNATLEDLAELLKRQQDVKLDAVVPATHMRSHGGVLHVKGLSVTEPELLLRPTAIFDGQIAERLGIPTAYLRELRNGRSGKDGQRPPNAVQTIELVSTKLRFTDEQQSLILDHFIKGGQLTAGGVMQAITSAAQVVGDADVAFDMENVAVEAMQLVAAG